MIQEERTELSEFGEFGLINKIKNAVEIKNKEVEVGIGDDAAVLNIKGKQVVSTDTLMEGVHFNLMYCPLKHLGYKAVVVNISDIYAMNARPIAITLSLAVSNRFSLEAIDEFYEGVLLACKTYSVTLAGGDVTSSYSGLGITVTAIGEAQGEPVLRSTAGKGDLIVVTGDLGGAYMGLQILERERMIYQENPEIQPDLGSNDYILERQLKPEARQDVVKILADLGVTPTSMMDISDGLASELHHICTASKKGCKIYEEKIPIDPSTYQTARDFDLDPTTCALNGGEDYELLFTISQDDFEKLKNLPDFSFIGHITEDVDQIDLITKDGNEFPITAQGWQHFKEKQ